MVGAASVRDFVFIRVAFFSVRNCVKIRTVSVGIQIWSWTFVINCANRSSAEDRVFVWQATGKLKSLLSSSATESTCIVHTISTLFIDKLDFRREPRNIDDVIDWLKTSLRRVDVSNSLPRSDHRNVTCICHRIKPNLHGFSLEEHDERTVLSCSSHRRTKRGRRQRRSPCSSKVKEHKFDCDIVGNTLQL